MEIFGADLDASKLAPREAWIRYPYSRSQNLESFSQALFRLLGIPEVSSDVSGNITMHQILRLLYADQPSPVEDLFRFERFDQPVLRDAIGRLLCGAYDSALYDNEIRIRSLTREFETINAELRSLLGVLSRSGQNLTLEWIAGQRRVLEEERQQLQSEIEASELELFTSSAEDQLTLHAQEQAYREVQRLQATLSEVQQKRDSLALNIADSAAFIASLENKLNALQDSSTVAQSIGEVRFHSCPACYAVVETELDESGHACHLCKTPFDSERAEERIVALINDTAIQLTQSRLLQTKREERTSKLTEEFQRLGDEWRQAARRLAELQRLPQRPAITSAPYTGDPAIWIGRWRVLRRKPGL
jgi:hypothetical protein